MCSHPFFTLFIKPIDILIYYLKELFYLICKHRSHQDTKMHKGNFIELSAAEEKTGKLIVKAV